jgi:nitrite reductase (NADH) small subunit
LSALARAALPAMRWIDICAVDDVVPESGACALIGLRQVALLRVGDSFYAVDNFDPFSKAFVMSRGLVGDRGGVPVVSSPIYKNAFDLRSGQSLDDAEVRLRTWPVRVVGGRVEVGDE